MSERVCRRAIGLIALVNALAIAAPCAAQPITDVVAGPPSCTECVRTETVATMGSPDSVAFGRRDLARIVRSSAGINWIHPAALGYAVAGFDAQDAVERWITRRGDGPREFKWVDALALGRGDSLLVFGVGKVNHYTPDGQFVRTARTEAQPMDVAVLKDGAYVIAGRVARPEALGRPLHVFGPDDGYRRSLYPPDWPEDRSFPPHVLAAAQDGGFWVGEQNRYRLDLLDVAGNHRERVERKAAWFEPYEKWSPPYEDPPLPRLWSAQEDGKGRLWTMLYVADRHFVPLAEPRRDTDLNAPRGPKNPTFDTVIEVIDLSTGTVVGQRRFDALLGGFLSGQHVVSPDLDARGEQVLRILKLSFVDGSR